MALIIKKRPTAPVPDLLPAREAPVQPQSTPRNPIYADKPIAGSPDDHRRDPNAYRSPPRTACTFCGHSYSWPCNGTDPKCMNAAWVRERQAKENADGKS